MVGSNSRTADGTVQYVLFSSKKMLTSSVRAFFL